MDKDHHSYCCDAPAVVVWLVDKDVRVSLCPSCRRWVETLESLGHKS